MNLLYIGFLNLCAALLLCSPHVSAATSSSSSRFSLEELSSGHGVIWGMAFLSMDELIFTERDGGIYVFSLATKKITPLSGAPRVVSNGQGGMLDVTAGPDYRNNGWLYFTYSKQVGDNACTTLARAKRKGKNLIEWQDLLVTRSGTDTNRHFGSRIAFDSAGHVFFTVGDRGFRPNGQDLTNHAGSVLRLNLDGTVPADNPFYETAGAMKEIYSYGHRNPQGLAYDAKRQRLWLIEHGPRGGDEINLIKPGANYGWPVVSSGMEYWGPVAVGKGRERDGIESPVKVYIPSIAPGSLLLYSGSVFPDWQDNLLAGALSLEHINRVELDDDGLPVGEERLLESFEERIRALVEGPEGYIYFSTDSGKIFRLVP